MLWVPWGTIIPGCTSGRAYYLGFGNVIPNFHVPCYCIKFAILFANKQPDFAYQTCLTPLSQSGRCRFVQHCALPEIIVTLNAFVTYACPIGSEWVFFFFSFRVMFFVLKNLGNAWQLIELSLWGKRKAWFNSLYDLITVIWECAVQIVFSKPF